MKNIKIANGQGFWGDSIEAPKELIRNSDIDYLTLDYLAEITLSIMQKQKTRNPKYGYASDFLNLIQETAIDLKNNQIKVVSNAGGVNPKQCSTGIKKILSDLNVNLNIGYIEGDDILNDLDDLISKGATLSNMDSGESISTIRDKICSANVYIDSYEIKELLDLGADIVLAGRVTDPGLTLGPLLHEFDWKKNDYNKLASGTLAGHIIECGAQCTGGNYTKWYEIEDLVNIGYPIVNVNSNGDFTVMKSKNSGGLINRFTVTEQILYEMGDPKKYISPDVCVDFTSFKLDDSIDGQVKISDVRGYQPTNTYKVSISYFAGYKSSGQLTICGPNAYEKAKKTAEIIWGRLSKIGCKFEETNTEFLGYNSCHNSINKHYEGSNEIVLRLSVKDKSKSTVNRFGMEISPVITSGPPGITGFAGGRPKAQEIIAYWPALIDKKLIKTKHILL